MTYHSLPTATGICNFLMDQANVNIGGIPATMAKKMGNWVGGQYTLTETEFQFSMNKLNAAFQKDASTVVIPRAAIRKATKGRLMIFFATVDLHTDVGYFRVRSTPKGTRALLAALDGI